MISCGDAEEFRPYGRGHMEHHPGNIGLPPPKPIPSNVSHMTLVKELNTVTLNSHKDWWELRKSKDGLTEEELYFVGKTVVWSRGQMGSEGSKFIIKSMTCDSEVLQAVFATFFTYPDLPSVVGDALPDEPTGIEIPSICILEHDCISVYSESGEDFSVALPFTVKKIWPMKYGLLIERQVTTLELTVKEDPEDALPVFYSLLHPLDEINPILSKTSKSDSLERQNCSVDSQHFLVSVHCEPSICILYTGFSSTVKICKVRRAKHEENVALFQRSVMGGGTSTLSTSYNSFYSSFYASPSLHLGHSGTTSSPHSNIPTPSSRPRSCLHHTPKTLQTPQSNPSRASASLLMNQQMRLGLSPSPLRCSHGQKTPKGMSHSVINETSIEPEPLIPDICLELMWSSYCSARPTSAFLTVDTVGQKFLCLLFPQIMTLKCFRYDLTNDLTSILVGPESQIQAKDAAPLDALRMMVIVDPSHSLLLYTGSIFICRLHLAGLSNFNSVLFKDFSYLNISSKLTSHLESKALRSSLLPSSTCADVRFDESLSPVVSQKCDSLDGSLLDDPSLPLSASIISVRDPTDFRLTLEHSSGCFYRVSLPVMCSSIIVDKSLSALKYTLPKEVATQLINKWYITRNPPGNREFSPQAEWGLFSDTVLSLIGYDIEKLTPFSHLDLSGSTSPLLVSKKFRATESGSESDWEYLLSSSYHHSLGTYWTELLQLDHLGMVRGINQSSSGIMNPSAPLFSSLPTILFSFHLVYEEFKVNTLYWDLAAVMCPCLMQLAADLKLPLYLNHYWKDFPGLYSLEGPRTQLQPQDASELSYPRYFTHDPPSVYYQCYAMMKGLLCKPFPYIPFACSSTKNIIQLYEVAATNIAKNNDSAFKYLFRVSPSGQSPSENSPEMPHKEFSNLNVHEKIVLLSDQLGIAQHSTKVMAPGLSLLLMNAQHLCSIFPPQDWPPSAYQLIERSDLVVQKQAWQIYEQQLSQNDRQRNEKRKYSLVRNDADAAEESSSKTLDKPKEDEDGMESLDMALLSLRWPEDQRVLEVRKMLCSSKPVCINIQQKPGVSDHDFVEEQERQLYALCIRTMALPMGRGMFTLCTHSPIITEALPIPPLNLKGRAPPRGTTIDFPVNEVPPDMDMWPLFHNGVAAGLKIVPNCGDITSTWIVYNKSKGEATVPHAGFLMALGLIGHLKNFATVNLHDYLSQGHELTCVGLLLGVSAAMRGTMDMQATKVLSVHLECLLPPTSTELDVPHSVQVASILGIGLVYADTGHRHMAEVLLQEIGRPPGPEMENSSDRESYSLSAGLGLGLIMFGRGNELAKISDLNLAGELRHYIEGGHKRPLNPAMREKYKSPSYQIKEGDKVNSNVTSPGATLALGMSYFRSGNRAIADWMLVPNTPYLLDQIRPDFLLLRTFSRGLILWDEVVPSYKWIEGHVPKTILEHVLQSGNQSIPGVDYESIHQAYYNILAGACFVLGIRFAGSANSEAFYVLWKYTKLFANFTKRSVAELAGKSTVETCLNCTLLSLSLVMAGTGDLEVLRLIRYLRSRIGVNMSTVGYGSHMAIHMALGFLFLGGGRFSLSTSNMSIAALIIACFPKFPTHSNDNRYHLQALRHLYVLAAEPRLLLPLDIASRQLRIAKIVLRFSDTRSYEDEQYVANGPHMLPELSKLREVIIEGDLANSRYWPVKFTKGTESWKVLENLLANGSGVVLKLKEGRFPYGEAPVGTSAKLSHLMMEEKAARWTIRPSVLKEAFGCSKRLIQCLVGSQAEWDDLAARKPPHSGEMPTLATLIYEYLCVGKPEVIDCWINALQGIEKIRQLNQQSGLLIWQIKLLATASCFLHNLGGSFFASYVFEDHPASPQTPEGMEVEPADPREMHYVYPLVSVERAYAFYKRLEAIVDSWEEEVKLEIRRYLKGDLTLGFTAMAAYTIILKDIPPPSSLPQDPDDEAHPLERLRRVAGFSLPAKSAASLAKQFLAT